MTITQQPQSTATAEQEVGNAIASAADEARILDAILDAPSDRFVSLSAAEEDGGFDPTLDFDALSFAQDTISALDFFGDV